MSRPMNGFIDVREDQWEQNELRKAQLAKELRIQMEEAREKKEIAKRQKLADDLAVEKKLEKDREEMKLREIADQKKQVEKNENRRLAALNFIAEQEKQREEAAKKAKD